MISSAACGMKGARARLRNRNVSAAWYNTVSRRGRSSGFLAKVHGAVLSTYWLPSWISPQMASNARLNSSALFCRERGNVPWSRSRAACWSSRSRSVSAEAVGFGTAPLANRSINVKVRFSKLPSPFARSLLIRPIKASREKSPSWPKGTSRSRKYRKASVPNSCAVA